MANNQLFRKRKKATEASLKRRVVNRQLNKRILIVFEGKETERRYFLKFVSTLNLKAIEVECQQGKTESGNEASDPLNIVNHAERKALSEGLPEDGGYEHIFCVFDQDSHKGYAPAKSKVFKLNKTKFPGSCIQAITSIPCFEIWLLYHFRYTRTPFVSSADKSPCACLIGEMKKTKQLRDCNKSLSDELLERLLPETDTAIRNARRSVEDAEATGEENPSTLVFKVIECLLKEQKLEAQEAKKSKDHW